MIRRISVQEDFSIHTRVLNAAFGTIADQYGLTKENSPTNNAFITSEMLKSQLTANREFYSYEEDAKAIGFIAIEKALNDPGTFYLEKVAVLPEYRHKHIGRHLMAFATTRIKELGGKRISIGLIDSNAVLKQWYEKQGYVAFGSKSFDHLPFDVCFMEKFL